jgi:uncharacterized C2H2 Zn-finger protein
MKNKKKRLQKTLGKKCPECGGLLKIQKQNKKTVMKGHDIIKNCNYFECLECGYVLNKNKQNKDSDKLEW